MRRECCVSFAVHLSAGWVRYSTSSPVFFSDLPLASKRRDWRVEDIIGSVPNLARRGASGWPPEVALAIAGGFRKGMPFAAVVARPAWGRARPGWTATSAGYHYRMTVREYKSVTVPRGLSPFRPTGTHSLFPVSATFVVPPSGGFPSSLAQNKDHETHETHEKQSRYRTGAHRGSRGRRWLALPTPHCVSPFRQPRRDAPKSARGGADASGASKA